MLLRARSFTFEMLVALTSAPGRHCLLSHCFMLTGINGRPSVRYEGMKMKRKTDLQREALHLAT
jgi:hypothetical protein